MNTDIKVGEKVKLSDDIRDRYGEIYLSKGEIVEISKIDEEKKGYEYELPYSFYVGRDRFEKLADANIQGIVLDIDCVLHTLAYLSRSVPSTKRFKQLKTKIVSFKKTLINEQRKYKKELLNT